MMSKDRLVVFDTKPYDKIFFEALRQDYDSLNTEIVYQYTRLNENTVGLAQDSKFVCVFVNDVVNENVVTKLKEYGVQLILLRCAGFNNVDLKACQSSGITVARVPSYSPNSVAEHALALILTLNRKIHHAYNKTRNGDFSLSMSLLGRDLCGMTMGIVGTGKIGKILANCLIGIGCKRIICYDLYRDPELEAKTNVVTYVDSLDKLLPECDVISLHSPLLPTTHHMINETSLEKMKDGVILVNTSRGGLIDTKALIRGLKSHKVGACGLDVYEDEEIYFHENWEDSVISDDVLSRLMTFNNVIITAHQAFFTREALDAISKTTLFNFKQFQEGKRDKDLKNVVTN